MRWSPVWDVMEDLCGYTHCYEFMTLLPDLYAFKVNCPYFLFPMHI